MNARKRRGGLASAPRTEPRGAKAPSADTGATEAAWALGRSPILQNGQHLAPGLPPAPSPPGERRELHPHNAEPRHRQARDGPCSPGSDPAVLCVGNRALLLCIDINRNAILTHPFVTNTLLLPATGNETRLDVSDHLSFHFGAPWLPWHYSDRTHIGFSSQSCFEFHWATLTETTFSWEFH